MNVVLVCVTVAVALLIVRPHTAAPLPPRLAVIIVVDQMRADYVDRFKGEWTSGLKRLVTQGAWFTHAAYPYLTTVTCAGHATVSTGAFPHTHGIVQNTWWDRESLKPVTCNEDADAPDVGYSADVKGGDSAKRLLVPTFADEMRAQRSAHVVTLALKDRSAIMLAGHGGDAITWLNNSLDGWTTSTAFAAAPVAAVKAFIDANPVDADYGKTWTPMLAAATYTEPDAAIGEAPPKGWTRTFPHALTGTGRPDADFRAQWERSPFADAYVGRFAAALAESMQLGRHESTDVLAISFSSPDLVGHAFGPNSQEVHDMYAHLDRTVGALLDRLDTLVGRDAYVVGLTGDHGVSAVPEQARAAGRDAGRIDADGLKEVIERRAQAAGPGTYVARVMTNDVYFERGMFEKLAAAPAALAALLKGLPAIPGILHAFRGDELAGAAKSPDALRRAAALSYVAGRSGDLIVVPKPGWMITTLATTHGNGTPDDQRVPLILMGAGIRAGRYTQPVTPADLTPTLAALCGITMPKAEGHALRAAMVP